MSVGSESLLYHAIRSHNSETVRMLIDAGADANQGNGILLIEAIEADVTEDRAQACEDILKILIAAGANVNAGEGRILRRAVQLGKAKYVQMLLDAGATVHP